MPKKCIICNGEALYRIKDSAEAYCSDCGLEHFGDLSYLQKIEDEAERLKAAIKERIDGPEHAPEH